MRQRSLLAGGSLLLAVLLSVEALGQQTHPAGGPIVGMYVHQHWSYNHPYAARTWTLDDWHGYAEGLSRLGYNTFLIWPMIETMPSPLTASDRAAIEKYRRVIEMLHGEFRMRVYFALCPNVGVMDEVAARYTVENRPFFQCDTRVNPADAPALADLLARREQLLRPLADVDGVAIIDSDPGGYAGSTNAEFVHLLGEHRKMLNRLRPGIELYYWMHAGWEAYSNFYATGSLILGSDAEHEDALRRLKDLNPEPWGVANGLAYARKLGIESRVVSFNYGLIEGEPSFPFTGFSPKQVSKGAAAEAPRGVMGNAQTHCIQLPNTLAFVRGAMGRTVSDEEYVQFADQLVVGHGPLIVRAWRLLQTSDAATMREVASQLETLAGQRLETGRLKGLLFGDPQRFLIDLVMQLRLKAACDEFCAASERRQDIAEPFARFITAARLWQGRHGYKNYWYWPRLAEALRRLESPPVNAILDQLLSLPTPFERMPGGTPFERVRNGLRASETFTPRLLDAMDVALRERTSTRPDAPATKSR